jgi:hypothetical protein
MKYLLSVSAVLTMLLLFVGTAQAQLPQEDPIAGMETEGLADPVIDPETYEPYRLPEGRRCTSGGETYQCFNLEEYIQLLQIDADLRFFELSFINAQEQIVRYERIQIQLQLALDAASTQIDTLQVERTRLLGLWQEENRLRLEAENRPLWGSWIAWGLAALEAAVIAGMSIALVL